MNLLLDTNILLFAVRDNSERFIEKVTEVKDEDLFISIVTLAEIRSIAVQSNWGNTKLLKLETLLERIRLVEITNILTDIYVEIDTFSQRKNPNFEDYSFETPRNMGKNDIWIASTATLLELTLVTTDKDFDHLNGVFLNIRNIAIDQIFK